MYMFCGNEILILNQYIILDGPLSVFIENLYFFFLRGKLQQYSGEFQLYHISVNPNLVFPLPEISPFHDILAEIIICA